MADKPFKFVTIVDEFYNLRQLIYAVPNLNGSFFCLKVLLAGCPFIIITMFQK